MGAERKSIFAGRKRTGQTTNFCLRAGNAPGKEKNFVCCPFLRRGKQQIFVCRPRLHFEKFKPHCKKKPHGLNLVDAKCNPCGINKNAREFSAKKYRRKNSSVRRTIATKTLWFACRFHTIQNPRRVCPRGFRENGIGMEAVPQKRRNSAF